MNYRAHFQKTITRTQRRLDQAMIRKDWKTYLELRHQMILIKEHVTTHESQCGYNCDCEPDSNWQDLI